MNFRLDKTKAIFLTKDDAIINKIGIDFMKQIPGDPTNIITYHDDEYSIEEVVNSNCAYVIIEDYLYESKYKDSELLRILIYKYSIDVYILSASMRLEKINKDMRTKDIDITEPSDIFLLRDIFGTLYGIRHDNLEVLYLEPLFFDEESHRNNKEFHKSLLKLIGADENSYIPCNFSFSNNINTVSHFEVIIRNKEYIIEDINNYVYNDIICKMKNSSYLFIVERDENKIIRITIKQYKVV